MSNLYGVTAYQQAKDSWSKTNNIKNSTKSESKETSVRETDVKTRDVKVSEFKPIDTKSPLVPTVKSGYGTVIGNAELSDKARDYYDKLKAKFHNMDFILVSKDMKSQVAANAAAYGNSAKQVVLIDDEKIERMANDESFRKKYEGIIAMSQLKLQEAKNSLASSGASVKNFGMSVDSNGNTSFFATLEKSLDNKALQKKAAEKKTEQKKAEKAKEKKLAQKKAEKNAEEERASEKKEAEKAEKNRDEVKVSEEYVEIKAASMEELIDRVSAYAYDSLSRNVLADSEKLLGQKIDFKG